jgi:hypothetical protein
MLVLPAAAQAQTVTTEKSDYLPGSWVVISGKGWSPSQLVTLQVWHSDGKMSATSSNLPWYIYSDSNGNISSIWYLGPEESSGSSYLVTADGILGGHGEVAFVINPAADIDQVRNCSHDEVGPLDCIALGGTASWVNGNAGFETAHYLEGLSIAYRVRMTEVPQDCDVTLILGYDIKHSDKQAIDYLTHYECLLPHRFPTHSTPENIDPLFFEGPDDPGPISATVTTFTIPEPPFHMPVDPDLGGPLPEVEQPTTSYNADDDGPNGCPHHMTLFGGTLLNIEYDFNFTNQYPQPDLLAAPSEQRIKVTFRLNSGVDTANCVLAWGGHIASRVDWGFPGDPRSAGGISGSPYHMRPIDWFSSDEACDGELGNLGNQDRSRMIREPQAPRCSSSIRSPGRASSSTTARACRSPSPTTS